MSNGTLDHSSIAARIPHAGSMCLLHSVASCTDNSIECMAISHTGSNNPLRHQGVLAPLSLIEYAAQAMAVHGSLLQERVALKLQSEQDEQGEHTQTPPPQGRLVSVRNVELFTTDLSLHPAPMRLCCELLLGDAQSSTFSFTAHAGDQLLGQGRASVMLVQAK
jgi:predicted hotdog family 3-hydroxylacyl-ACP dehydratase